MFTKRIIPCLDVHNGRVVKGVNFVNLKDAGDPVEIAAAYDKAGADELVFLDITASSDARNTVVDMVREVAKKVFIPFTVGGGIRTVEDFRRLMQSGVRMVPGGMYTKTAAAWIWELMQLNGRCRQTGWEPAKFFLRVWTVMA